MLAQSDFRRPQSCLLWSTGRSESTVFQAATRTMEQSHQVGIVTACSPKFVANAFQQVNQEIDHEQLSNSFTP
jgi:hypothetical protein